MLKTTHTRRSHRLWACRLWALAICAPLLAACGGGSDAVSTAAAPRTMTPTTPTPGPDQPTGRPSVLGTDDAIMVAARAPGVPGSRTQSAVSNDNGVTYGPGQDRVVATSPAAGMINITLPGGSPVTLTEDEPIDADLPAGAPFSVGYLSEHDQQVGDDFTFVRVYHTDWENSGNDQFFAGGYWVSFDDSGQTPVLSSMGAFMDGTEFVEEGGGTLPIDGTADYVGGTEGPLHLLATDDSGYAWGNVGLEANFATPSISGDVDDIRYEGAGCDEDACELNDFRILLDAADITPTNGFFSGTSSIASTRGTGSGTWGGFFMGGPVSSANNAPPEAVGGTIGVAGGSGADAFAYIGTFIAFHSEDN